jgi:hypothetical protein
VKDMIDEEKSCCMCGTTKFIGRVNLGEKYYCNSCMKKIRDSGMDYFKPCSQSEFFSSMVSHMKKHDDDDEPPSMYKNIRRVLREAKEDEENNSKL